MNGHVVIVATAWGSKHGGINTFSNDLCMAMAKILSPKHQVVCVVSEASKDEITDAFTNNVVLIAIGLDLSKADGEEQTKEIIKKLKDSIRGKILCFIGHDIITGPIAIKLAQHFGECKTAIVHHMNYLAYDTSKKIARSLSEKYF